MHIPRPISMRLLSFYALLCLVVLLPNLLANRPAEAAYNLESPAGLLQLDPRLPVQTFEANTDATNINAAFGSRFDFNVQPAQNQVYSGTEGVFHDTPASYVVGVVPQGQSGAEMFHMGGLNAQLSDSYLLQERWQQGLDTTRWMGDTNPETGLHITLDIIDAFQGEPGCTELSACISSVQADIAPTLYIGIQLQNFSAQTQQGNFLFGSNRQLAANSPCETFNTASLGTAINSLSYASSADPGQGTLFLAGDQQHWSCQTQQTDRAGLSWAYSLAAGKSATAYMLLGGWNSNPSLLVNTHLANSCQNEPLYYTKLWSTQEALIGYALDTLGTQLDRAQSLEQLLLNNDSLPAEQRWLIGNTLRSYKASSWLTARTDCAGGGYDATVYEGSYGFLSTVDVMYEYSYFEIMQVPWFFKAAIEMVFSNATHDQQGFYFQHDQGAEVDSQGNCTTPGHGIPTFRNTCYIPPYVTSGVPMPTEENNNVALLSAYYVSATDDIDFVQEHMQQLEAAMQHNLNVGDPQTGIAANGQDTATTFDAANDCLHNTSDKAGNLYYQGLKEASAYIATDYLASLLPAQQWGGLTDWQPAAAKIEQSMISAYKLHGYLPVADNSAYSNCDGRTIMQGDGLFYLQISGLEQRMNPTVLRELALQYPADVKAATFQGPSAPLYVVGNPPLYLLESKRAVGTQQQCANDHCLRYTWFSKVMLSSIVADTVYSQYGCASCLRMNLDQAAYAYNINFPRSFSDGAREYVGYWEGFIYPRGIISWFYLDRRY